MSHAQRDKQLRQALASGDPFAVAAQFQLPELHRDSVPAPSSSSFQKSSKRLQFADQDWSSVVNHLIDACQHAEKGDVVQCYDSQAALHSAFNQVLASSTGNWLVPALLTIGAHTQRMARATKQSAKLEHAASILQESFSRTYNDRNPVSPSSALEYNQEDGSKKTGVLGVVNLLFAVYFKLNTLRLCKNLVKPVQAKQLHHVGSMADKVTYHYYVGRIFMMEDNYEQAEAQLEYAMRYCHPDAVANQRRILSSLVPVKLYRGRLPSQELLEQHNLLVFAPFVKALRQGNLKTFNEALQAHQDVWIRQGTYLLLEKCKLVCYRNLFKRIHYVLDNHLIPLSSIVDAFAWLDVPMDLDEVECILANLIYRSYVRGYLSHAKRVLVLSKRDPFPVAAVIANKTDG